MLSSRTRYVRSFALISLLLFLPGIAASGTGEEQAGGREAAASDLEMTMPIGVVSDPEVLKAAAEWYRRRALERGLIGPGERASVAAPVAGLLPADPLFPFQWHLLNTGQDPCQAFGFTCTGGTPGVDVNVVDVWGDYAGAGIKAAIREWGVEITHPDITANYDSSVGDGAGDDSTHGTPVLGLVVAVEGNGVGGVGGAYQATAARIGFGNTGDAAIEEVAQWADVASRSGSGFYAEDKELLATQGRGGLGTINFQSAGNGRTQGWHINIDTNRSSRHGIVVGSIDFFGVYSFYSNPGSSLLVMAPGELAIAPVRQGTGPDGGDYALFAGTSAAAPVAAGVGALVLEANPALGYRDVQEIFAYAARQIDLSDPDAWAANDAGNWNGGGLFVSLDYGFGLIDAHAAVRLAETWPRSSTAANELRVEATAVLDQLIPDGGSLSDTVSIPPSPAIDIDFVEVRVDLSHVIASVDVQDEEEIVDLTISLRSPAGTESLVLTPMSDLDPGIGVILAPEDPFPSTRLWGESGAGDWTITIADSGLDGVSATLESWTLTLYGDPAGDDDTYIFTGEFARFTTPDDAGRRLLEDGGGHDTVNAAPIAGDVVLDLRPGATSTLAGNSLTIGGGTWIEDAFTGDGDDLIVGNDADNTLRPGRGDDVVDGGAGHDVAVFAGERAGYDVTIGAGVQVLDLLPEVAGDEGADDLSGVEVLRFSDQDLALGDSSLPTLTIADGVPALPQSPVSVPVDFDNGGEEITSLAFSVDFDETCLAFDPTDGDGDGIPDAVSLDPPPGFSAAVTVDLADTDGEIDFLIFNLSGIPLPNAQLAAIEYIASCSPTSGSVTAPVRFSQAPPPSFGDSGGASVPGAGIDGSVEILAGIPGDCNGDGTVDAGDVSASGLEIFDGDGSFWLDVPNGGFPGNAPGCDSNRDTVVDAGDVSCTAWLIFDPDAACAAAGAGN